MSPTYALAGLIQDPVFRGFSRDFGDKFEACLQSAFKNRKGEVWQVNQINSLINTLGGMSFSSKNISVKVDSIFMHGSRSMVTYNNGTTTAKCELADIAFISTLKINNCIYMQRMTLNQVKKSEKNSQSWKIDKTQLKLLSSFPKFTGCNWKTNLFPGKSFHPVNISGCLGSYGLIHSPGGFIFMNAKDIASATGSSSSINIRSMQVILNSPFENFYTTAGIYSHSYLTKISWRFIHYGVHAYLNFLSAKDCHDFANKYLAMGIGEPVFLFDRPVDTDAQNVFSEIVRSVRDLARNQPSTNTKAVLDSFNGPYFGDDSNPPPTDNQDQPQGGENMLPISVIHATISIEL